VKRGRMRAEEGLTGAPRSGLWLDDEESEEGALEADALCCERRTDQEAEEGGGQRQLSGAGGAAARAWRLVSDVREWRVESVCSTRAGWGCAGDEYLCWRPARPAGARAGEGG
jgi:hypothetical protein